MGLLMEGFAKLVLLSFIIMVMGAALWVASCVAHYKMLKKLGYDYPIAAWIPFWSSYAIADLVVGEDKEIVIFGVKIPAMVFKLYWLITMALFFIPFVGKIAAWVLSGICLGTCYGYIYAALDDDTYEEHQVLGFVSGFVIIVAIIELFILLKTGKKGKYYG